MTSDSLIESGGLVRNPGFPRRLSPDVGLRRLHDPQRVDDVAEMSASSDANDWTLSRERDERGPGLTRQASDPAFRRSLDGGEYARRTSRYVRVATYRLTRALGRVSGTQKVCETVLQYVVRTVPSRLAAFAVRAEENHLAIVATLGYPVETVNSIRIAPGDGIIGEVFQNGRPLCVSDIAALPALRRHRPRYRTNSFMALPILSGSSVLGVVCVADRADREPFTPRDLSVLRELTAPAALALARERARQQAEAFAQAAAVDSVSGLFNRRFFERRLEEEVQRADRHEMPVALLMIDIDDFKGINDSFGHLAGDSVIRDVSDILRRSVRRFDLCARFGGEEFAVVMPGSGLENAATVAERIRQRIAEHIVEDPALRTLRITVSIGLCVSNQMTPRQMVDAADQALYAAKRGGKNRVVGPTS